MDHISPSDLIPDEVSPAQDDSLEHPWIDEMRQFESEDETLKEAEKWF